LHLAKEVFGPVVGLDVSSGKFLSEVFWSLEVFSTNGDRFEDLPWWAKNLSEYPAILDVLVVLEA
jgi:hypothetical protein